MLKDFSITDNGWLFKFANRELQNGNDEIADAYMVHFSDG